MQMAELYKLDYDFKQIKDVSNSLFLKFLKERNLSVSDNFRSFLEKYSGPVLAFNSTFRLLFINTAMRNFCGEHTENLNNLSVDDLMQFIHPHNKQQNSHNWTDTIKQGLLMGQSFFSLVRFKNGKKVPVFLAGTPLSENNGHIVGGVALMKIMM
jgi:PAS domain S-box-containing protein